MSAQFSRVILNGQLIPLEQAQISLTHPIFTASNGIYETIKIDKGRPFHLYNHLERLTLSASFLELKLPNLETLNIWANNLIKSLALQSYTIQILVIGQANPKELPVIAMFPRKTPTYSDELYSLGATAVTFEGQRFLPQCKSFNTLVNHLARTTAYKTGATEAILTHNNQMLEGARSNLFVVEANSNQLLTPPTSKVLSGITRDIVIQLMRNTSSPVKERDIYLDMAITEMFITSTSMNILPIVQLNHNPIGDGQVGPVTKQAMQKFKKYYTNKMISKR